MAPNLFSQTASIDPAEAKRQLVELLVEVERVRSNIDCEESDPNPIGDVMQAQLGILEARIRQHCRRHPLPLPSLDSDPVRGRSARATPARA